MDLGLFLFNFILLLELYLLGDSRDTNRGICMENLVWILFFCFGEYSDSEWRN